MGKYPVGWLTSRHLAPKRDGPAALDSILVVHGDGLGAAEAEAADAVILVVQALRASLRQRRAQQQRR